MDTSIYIGLSLQFAAPYSCWSVIMTVYNLPLGMCMRPKFMFFIYGHTRIEQSERNIDVCLRPLIDELTQLWSSGALTYDISRKHNFAMGAALMWTINDLVLFCNHKNMKLVCDGSWVAKPKASFMLEKNTQLLVYKWLKSLHFSQWTCLEHIKAG